MQTSCENYNAEMAEIVKDLPEEFQKFVRLACFDRLPTYAAMLNLARDLVCQLAPCVEQYKTGLLNATEKPLVHEIQLNGKTVVGFVAPPEGLVLHVAQPVVMRRGSDTAFLAPGKYSLHKFDLNAAKRDSDSRSYRRLND